VDWGFWIAAAALVAGAGKFLDDYHMSGPAKSRIRGMLTSGFLWLEEHPVPDPSYPMIVAFRSFGRLSKVIAVAILLIICSWAVITFLYFLSCTLLMLIHILISIFGTEADFECQPYFTYIYQFFEYDKNATNRWTLAAVSIASSVAGTLLMSRLFKAASDAGSQLLRLGLLIAGLVAGPLAAAAVGAAVAALVEWDYVSFYIYFYTIAAAVALPVLLGTVTIVLLLAKLVIASVRFVALNVFSAGSSPNVSPFTYAAALIGVAILGVKVIQAAVLA
jgi:hypothetical protein